MSRVTPVFKNGDKASVRNYRPISILNAMAKLFERLVDKHLPEAFTSLTAEEQHGF